ncbi:MAG: hypothetical protein WA789_16615 [Candidatus Acidiferrum sp.]
MHNKAFPWAVRTIAIVVLTIAASAQAQAPRLERLHGIINDYTPATGVSGPWEMHGSWSLNLKRESAKADFFAVLTMEHSDYWVLANPTTPPATPNVDNPAARSPHTHHITMTDAMVSYDTSVCPVNNPPTTSAGFVVTGPVSITGNGNPAPFEVKGQSTLQVCITGGAEVQFSNVTLVLTGPATGHFGTHAINGVVRKTHDQDSDRDDRDHSHR